MDMSMATLGTFLAVFLLLAILTFGIVPWLWHHRTHMAMLMAAIRRRYVTVDWHGWTERLADDHSVNSDRFPGSAQALGNPHSDAAEPPRNHPSSQDRELGSEGSVPVDRDIIWTIDELIVLLAGLSIRWPDGSVGPVSTSRLADLYGGRRQDALAHVKALIQPEPVSTPVEPPAYDPEQHLLVDNGRRIIPRT